MNGHAEEVQLLLPLTNIENHFEDGLRQNLTWWVRKSGCVEIINLVQHWAQNWGSRSARVTSALGPLHPSEQTTIFCNVCTRYIMPGRSYYHCEACYKFALCRECSGFGAQCLDASHN
ncbi:hypothetical protein N7536_007312 [Penicillium majusculum]|uniref:ZZ-type domain-containing protein n=1 Tax=Penicillium solitum TaxID=60172 RepID=A0A1V6RKB1_9EURO|nr:uncharacterized protein PENSOL_c002G08398 [Penicillium solitum]KAJ5696900.1 hypothetical protein N7536_007312 [Penicillium majusculum]OQE02271.1 hypothetical protein PENSOL_c002G08398 [Penicillium solitum]